MREMNNKETHHGWRFATALRSKGSSQLLASKQLQGMGGIRVKLYLFIYLGFRIRLLGDWAGYSIVKLSGPNLDHTNSKFNINEKKIYVAFLKKIINKYY